MNTKIVTWHESNSGEVPLVTSNIWYANEPLTIPVTVCPESHSIDSGMVKKEGAAGEGKLDLSDDGDHFKAVFWLRQALSPLTSGLPGPVSGPVPTGLSIDSRFCCLPVPVPVLAGLVGTGLSRDHVTTLVRWRFHSRIVVKEALLLQPWMVLIDT